MRVRKFDSKEDMLLVKDWWFLREDIVFSSDILSDHGYMAEIDGEPAVAMFFFPVQGSKVAWMGWPISDPDTDKEQRSLALTLLFDTIHEDAKSMGYSVIFTISGLSHVQERLVDHGYLVGDTNVNQFWRAL